MFLPILIACAIFCSAFPLLLFVRNLKLYAMPPRALLSESISILIPARNEEDSIAPCVRAALASQYLDLEVLVLDDHSEDRTAEIVQQISAGDQRVKLFRAPDLPAGWCGKQFACWVLAGLAAKPALCFLDADVQLTPSGLASMIAAMRAGDSHLVSGFPRQIMRTAAEQLLLPLMHFLLLGFLPLDQMRRSLHPSLGAGCGQFIVVEREAYRQAGGHRAIRGSRHDGILLPRAFRRAGFKTDLCDATAAASCRMYRNATEVVRGLLKNATEGIAAPRTIISWSLLLFLGQILPLLLVVYVFASGQSLLLRLLSLAALVASLLPRVIAAFQFDQPLAGALLHPFGIASFLAIQWLALIRSVLHIPECWKGRTCSPVRY